MHEELGITIKDACLMQLAFASHSYPDFHLLMPLFLCRRWEGIAQPREGQKVKWVRIKDLALNAEQYPMPPADAPLIPLLRDLL
jgi:8-oxo-dGTP diphosphatase